MDFSEQTWTKAELRRTGIAVSLAVLVIAALLFFGVDWNIERRKAQQKLERLYRDLMIVQVTLNQMQRADGAFPAPAEGALPKSISEFYARNQGDAPYYQDLARYLRLDLFAAEGPQRAPLGYWVKEDGDRWIVISRGPDQDFDLTEDTVRTWEPSKWLLATYDPTNGVASSGDIWIYNGAE
ncbi:preprotein translocase subunit SecE [bacterium]|nr:preprotein translocase subunit SecE [bacterium]